MAPSRVSWNDIVDKFILFLSKINFIKDELEIKTINMNVDWHIEMRKQCMLISLICLINLISEKLIMRCSLSLKGSQEVSE